MTASTVTGKGTGAAFKDIANTNLGIGLVKMSTRISDVEEEIENGGGVGIDSVDHSQFLLVNGTRPLTGDLNLNNNDITSVSTINNIVIEDHSDRHLPNGADGLITAAPNTDLSTSSTNSAGIQNSFARSDHSHSIVTSSSNTASTIVARDSSGNFAAGTITANLSGNATTATTATNFSANLLGHVSGTQSATVIAEGVITNAMVNSSAGIVDSKLATISTVGKVSNSATTATANNTNSAIVARDSFGNFAAGTITANLSGNATSSTDFTGNLAGHVSGTQDATVIENGIITNAMVNSSAGIVDTKLATISTAGKVSNSATTATANNTNSAIVARDGSGNFAAGTITANLTGNITGNVTGNADTASDGLSSASGTAPLTLNLSSKSLTGSVALASGSASGIISSTQFTKLASLPALMAFGRNSIDNSTNSTNIGNIISLGFSIAANEIWQFEFHLVVSSASTNGIKVAINAPDGATLQSIASGQISTYATTLGTNLISQTVENITSINTLSTTTWVNSSGFVGNVTIKGLVVNGSTAGTVQARYASGTSGQSIVVKANSYFLAHKFA